MIQLYQKFTTKKWVEVNDLSSGQYSVNKSIKFKTSMLRSDLCDYSDAHIVVKGRINVKTTENTDVGGEDVAFKNNAPFRSCITKINSKLIDDAEDLSIVMPMYNLLEYSQNNSMTSGSLWNYYRDEINDVYDNSSDSKSCKYKTKLIGKIEARADRPAQPGPDQDSNPQRPPNKPAIPPPHIEVVVPLKYLSNFWRSLD